MPKGSAFIRYLEGSIEGGRPFELGNKKEKAKAWTDSEIERVLEALAVLPDALLNSGVSGIFRMQSFLDYPANPAANHDHAIVLYDEAFKTKQNLARILSHEFAHVLYQNIYGEDHGVSYADAADWMARKTSSKAIILIPNRDGFVEEDGKESPNEDFSNNIEYFLFKPSDLKSKTPKVYQWIAKRYGDKFKLGKESK